MIRRVWRYVLLVLAIILIAALGAWFWHRPPTPATLEHANLEDGTAITRVTPASRVKTRIALAVSTKDKLSDKQLQALGTDAGASVIQVELPADDCVLQEKVFQAALQKLDGPAQVVGGIGHGATLAWRWLATQDNDKAQAISVGFALQHVSNPPPEVEEGETPPQICDVPLPQKAPHGHWLAAFNDAPDDPSAAFVRDQPNAETSISDYDIPLPQVLNTELRHLLLGENDTGGSGVPTVEVPSAQSSDTVTLFLSGDGGWRDLDKVVAGDMAKVGYPVVGIDVLRYYWERKSPEQTAADLTELMNHYRQKWGSKRFILAGYSFGADVLPAIYNRMAPEDQERIDGIILLAFARSGNFEIHVDGWLGNAGTEAKTGPEMAKLPANKVLCVYGAEEKKDSGCTDTTAVGEVLELPGGHHFDENYPALAKRLMHKIDQWQGKP
ncbi:AcvB/VirJ family lysyl-phosphatidylglycerol hydrolase [Pseudomonas sp. DTU_2021_1001937_2_SI_NGA_ILE_001]|uniref:virulence factor family protein n=1 Tax=Pseudomonas sp. DTU_2021_1001937_2_SI_NGA_ILE_001 TaxID=3077589 RepID=UPI0025DDEBB3|nr:AcvB/VirJ family lysyl-phosphatidylglycerol hydrolase [Pseudomonas sp. DTU_2021_1001937_2_SI_NGA_ILE_001]WNW11301.1 AcvB/VirJ family lysyl-phosphatidylglycerol hydrolase [Pseudomonas sp. DTU_2021_1001937_2_SI_NGA_ILE_001]